MAVGAWVMTGADVGAMVGVGGKLEEGTAIGVAAEEGGAVTPDVVVGEAEGVVEPTGASVVVQPAARMHSTMTARMIGGNDTGANFALHREAPPQAPKPTLAWSFQLTRGSGRT